MTGRMTGRLAGRMTGRGPRSATAAPRLRARRGGRALLLVAACFAASAGLRLAERGAALANAQPAPGPGSESPSGTAPASMPVLNRPLPDCVPDPGTDALLAAIRAREATLDARAGELAAQEQVVKVAKAKIAEQIAALTDAEKKLAATLAIADKAAEADLARLVAVYEAMKPKAAAQIFATMDVSFAAGFLGRMKPDIAGAILAGIPAERAYAISAVLAGRNARAPTE
jgi:flagellar motility protein MotE (MotC chaperone)